MLFISVPYFRKEKKDKFRVTDKIREKAFEIRLQSSNKVGMFLCSLNSIILLIMKEVDISKNPNFIKLLETQYASKYLETMDIEPSQKNINTVLKFYPLMKCQISSSWNDSR